MRLVGFIVAASVSLGIPASAQQAPVPFTDWRAAMDADLSKLSMPRDAHMAIFNILQERERQAQAQRPATTAPSAESPK